jgi:hypothetical protein
VLLVIKRVRLENAKERVSAQMEARPLLRHQRTLARLSARRPSAHAP